MPDIDAIMQEIATNTPIGCRILYGSGRVEFPAGSIGNRLDILDEAGLIEFNGISYFSLNTDKIGKAALEAEAAVRKKLYDNAKKALREIEYHMPEGCGLNNIGAIGVDIYPDKLKSGIRLALADAGIINRTIGTPVSLKLPITPDAHEICSNIEDAINSIRRKICEKARDVLQKMSESPPSRCLENGQHGLTIPAGYFKKHEADALAAACIMKLYYAPDDSSHSNRYTMNPAEIMPPEIRNDANRALAAIHKKMSQEKADIELSGSSGEMPPYMNPRNWL